VNYTTTDPPGTEEIVIPHAVVVSIEDFLSQNFPPRENLLAPWLKTQSLNMLYAWRGIGKTFFALEIAYAVASGGSFLGWTAPKPRGVLYIDGEMPGTVLQERIARIVSSSEQEAAPGMFKILTPDLQAAGMPNLSEREGQQEIDRHIDEAAELIIVDNLSCLVRGGGRENDAESWLAVQEWALRLRSRGKSVLFIHHAGKGGAQRGTSKREDVLDVVLLLKRPTNYEQSEGCHVEIHYEKARGLTGADVEPVEARLVTEPDETRKWEWNVSENALPDIVKELAELGMERKEIIRELKESYGKSSATAYRLTKEFFPNDEKTREKTVRKW
jgi:hypothetical protein